jgi:endonuclease/exonuclease/phosphatase family metal-dependent hydrolase
MIVMSYNIRFDNPGDGINQWSNRKERVASLLSHYHPDIVGLQEAMLHQISYLDSSLVDYSWVGVGRDDGVEKGEYSPIFYDSTKLDLLDWGTFWLSTNPDSPSKGWDAALPRICTWARLMSADNQEFYFLNTHFDHRGEKARFESSKLIITKIREFNTSSPIVLAGDFNQTTDSPGYKSITSFLTDASSESTSYGPEGTFSGFESGKELGNRIDYIFLGTGLICKKFQTITDHNGQYYPSDHLPIMAIVTK